MCRILLLLLLLLLPLLLVRITMVRMLSGLTPARMWGVWVVTLSRWVALRGGPMLELLLLVVLLASWLVRGCARCLLNTRLHALEKTHLVSA